MKRSPMPRRSAPLRRTGFGTRGDSPHRSPMKRGKGFGASVAQRQVVRGESCVVCGAENVDPAHLIDRSLGGDDDPRAVVPLCRNHHREYDEGELNLLPHLEPAHRYEIAYAVELVGLERAYRRITNAPPAPAQLRSNLRAA